MSIRNQLCAIWMAGSLAPALLSAAPVYGATYLVTNINDSGAGSLRQAVLNANASPGADIINFDAGVFNTPLFMPLTSGEMAITEAVSINGPAFELSISGNNLSRIFNINGAGNMIVGISNLRLVAANAGGNGHGGAILIWDERVTLTNCKFGSNMAAIGGAISVEAPGGTLTISQCFFDSNQSVFTGGAIAAIAAVALSIDKTTFRGGIASAGAAINQNGGGMLLIDSSTFFQNASSPSDGGAVFLNSAFTSATVRNSTFTSNIANGNGGAINLGTVFSTALNVLNCTIVSNRATTANGGGIARTGGAASILLTSTIMTGNIAANPGPDLYTTGGVTASACLLASTAGVASFIGDEFTNSHIGVNPLINPIAFNGGPTLSHSLKAGSPAIDAGANPQMLSNDQRGAGFLRTVDGICPNGGPAVPDIGSYELQQCTCIGDANGSGSVNIDDLVLVITAWGDTGPNEPDINNDQVVNIDDLVLVVTHWGSCP